MNLKSQYLALGALILIALNFFYSKIDSDESPQLPAEVVIENEQIKNEPEKPNRVLPPPNTAENLLHNGEFEQSLNGWAYEAGVFWSDNGGVDKSGALLINAPAIESESRVIYSKAVEQCIALLEGAIFGLEAYFRYADTLPERPSVNRIHLYWYDGKNCSSGGQYGGYIEPNLEKHTWQKILKNNFKPALGATSALIRIEQRQDGNNNAQAYWDGVNFFQVGAAEIDVSTAIGDSIYTKPMSENYIQNPRFDINIEHWWPKGSRRLRWKAVGDKPQGVMAATLPKQGDGSMGTGSFSQCVNLGVRQRYELGAKVMASPESSQTGGGRLRATWYEGFDCEGRYRGARNHADVDHDIRGWQSLHVDDLRPSQGAKSVSIGIVHSIDGQGQHTLYWDDFYFRAY